MKNSTDSLLFDNRSLAKLIFPLFIEQFLLMFVGIADTFTVSFSSEADVSGVSLVTSFNTVMIFLFTAMSSGGAVVISQYLGRKDTAKASRSAGQLLMISTVISVVLTILILCFRRPLLRLLFGKIDDKVMEACDSYLWITTLSLPFLAIYDAGAALLRSTGKTNVTMNIQLISNILNIVGNCLCVFLWKMGASGVAWPSLVSRLLSSTAVTIYCFLGKNSTHYNAKDIFSLDKSLLKKILKIAVPSGVENGVHQLVKVALSSMVALFGTYQIAANGVAQSIWSLASIMGLAMSPVFTTVIGKCMGAKDIQQAKFYFRKLTIITLVLSIIWNGITFAITPVIVSHSAISEQAKNLVIWLVLINNIFNAIAYPFAGPLGDGLKATGDIKFTMITSITLTLLARLFFSALFGLWLNLGAIGVAIGMSIDLVIRGILYLIRLISGKWTHFQII